MILFISLTLIYNVILLIFLFVSQLVSSPAPACRFDWHQQRRREHMEPIRTEHCNCSDSSSVRSAYVSRVTACSTTQW